MRQAAAGCGGRDDPRGRVPPCPHAARRSRMRTPKRWNGHHESNCRRRASGRQGLHEGRSRRTTRGRTREHRTQGHHLRLQQARDEGRPLPGRDRDRAWSRLAARRTERRLPPIFDDRGDSIAVSAGLDETRRTVGAGQRGIGARRRPNRQTEAISTMRRHIATSSLSASVFSGPRGAARAVT